MSFRSLINNRNKRGPKLEPCGTPNEDTQAVT